MFQIPECSNRIMLQVKITPQYFGSLYKIGCLVKNILDLFIIKYQCIQNQEDVYFASSCLCGCVCISGVCMYTNAHTDYTRSICTFSLEIVHSLTSCLSHSLTFSPCFTISSMCRSLYFHLKEECNSTENTDGPLCACEQHLATFTSQAHIPILLLCTLSGS